MSEAPTYVVNGVTREHLEQALQEARPGDPTIPGLVEAAWLNLCFAEQARREEWYRLQDRMAAAAEVDPSTLESIGYRHLSRLETLLQRLEATTAERPIPSRCDTRLPHVPHGWFRGDDVKFQCPGVPS